jgi:hypothetical protein
MAEWMATTLATQPPASDRTCQHLSDDALDLSSADAPQQHQADGFLPTRNRKVVGSNPTSGSISAGQRVVALALLAPRSTVLSIRSPRVDQLEGCRGCSAAP